MVWWTNSFKKWFIKAPTKWKNSAYIFTEIDISLAYNKGIKLAFKKPSAFFSSLVLLEMPKKLLTKEKKQICCESLFYDIISSSIFFCENSCHSVGILNTTHHITTEYVVSGSTHCCNTAYVTTSNLIRFCV